MADNLLSILQNFEKISGKPLLIETVTDSIETFLCVLLFTLSRLSSLFCKITFAEVG